jgi:phosphopantetheinyl transferase (holo-ACP synthase)
VKALALDFWDPHDIEVMGAAEPAPSVHLSGRAEIRARELGATVSVSLSHAGGIAGAVAHAWPYGRSQIRANA